jgi:hypothetical protein
MITVLVTDNDCGFGSAAPLLNVMSQAYGGLNCLGSTRSKIDARSVVSELRDHNFSEFLLKDMP